MIVIFYSCLNLMIMRLCHPPDGSTSPMYKLLCLNHHNLFYQIRNVLAFNWDMCCHLALCLWLLPFHCINGETSNVNIMIDVSTYPG